MNYKLNRYIAIVTKFINYGMMVCFMYLLIMNKFNDKNDSWLVEKTKQAHNFILRVINNAKLSYF